MYWTLSIAATALCAALAAGVACYSMRLKISGQSTKLTALEAVLKKMVKTNKNTQHQLVELHAANNSLVSQLTKLGVIIEQTVSRQSDIETHDPESKLYTRAVRMVELGADLEEVMRECELPKAEAELLFTLHGKNT